MDNNSVAVSSVRSIIDYLQSQNLLCQRQKTQLLDLVGLSESQLKLVEHRISVSQYAEVWKQAVKLSGDPAIGLRVGDSYKLANISLISSLVLYGESFAEGLARYVDYAQVIHSGLSVKLISQGDEVCLSFQIEPDCHYIHHDAERMMALCVSRFRHFSETPFDINGVSFTHSAPDYLDVYHEVFDCRINFDASFMGVRFPSSYLQQTSRFRNPYVFRSLLEQAKNIQGRLQPSKIASRVEQILTTEIDMGHMDIRLVAQKLNMTRQTLYRKLKQEGRSFSDVLDKVRLNKAREALHDRSQGLCEIALSLGFSDSSAFSRAFKRWTGRSPQHYRNEVLSI